MAQFKEYSANDFLYSGYTDEINGEYCNKTDVGWDELIQEACYTFATGIYINLIINGKTYTVTSEGSGENNINTIKEIADEFTKHTPYNFSYKSIDGNNYLTIDAAKITFNDAGPNSAITFLGYKEDLAHNKLPFTLPDKINVTATADYTSQYAFDSSYNMLLNVNKSVDIRAASNKPYYSDKSLVSGLNEAIATPVYVNNLQLVRHLNKKMIGYGESPSESSADIGNCFYKFAYDYNVNRLIVSDLILYSKPTVTSTGTSSTLTLTFKVCSTNTTGTVNRTKDYTYTIIKPIESNSDAMSVNDVVLTGTVFRKFDYTLDTMVDDNATPTDSTDDTITYNKKKVTAPTVKLGTNTTITGVYENGLFVCYLNNTEIPTFQIAFDSISGNPILMCSGSKYVKITDLSEVSIYYTLPYTKQISNTASGGDSTCETANLNKSLCDNKKSAKTIIDKTQKHPGFDQQYIDAKGFSDMSVLNIINLGIGIIAAVYFIAKTYK